MHRTIAFAGSCVPFTQQFFRGDGQLMVGSGEQRRVAQPFLWGGGELRAEGGE